MAGLSNERFYQSSGSSDRRRVYFDADLEDSFIDIDGIAKETEQRVFMNFRRGPEFFIDCPAAKVAHVEEVLTAHGTLVSIISRQVAISSLPTVDKLE